MIASFDPARESKRPAEYAEAKQRAVAAREARVAATAGRSGYEFRWRCKQTERCGARQGVVGD